jgi:serine/threonine-protein kinase RsbW
MEQQPSRPGGTPAGPPKRCEFDSADLILRLDLTVPAEVEHVGPVVGRILAIVGEMGCAEGKEFEIELALHEALANAIIHGCKRDPGKEVQLWVGCDAARGMIIGLRDPGEGFDPRSLPSPVEGRQLYASHGRGVFLINQLMDEVHWAEGGTEIWMIKR